MAPKIKHQCAKCQAVEDLYANKVYLGEVRWLCANCMLKLLKIDVKKWLTVDLE